MWRPVLVGGIAPSEPNNSSSRRDHATSPRFLRVLDKERSKHPFCCSNTKTGPPPNPSSTSPSFLSSHCFFFSSSLQKKWARSPLSTDAVLLSKQQETNY